MKIEPLPHSGALRKWTNDLVSEATRCSNRSKRRTLRYLRVAFGSDCIEPLEAVPPKWDPFDTELACAMAKAASGSISREIQLYQESCTRQLKPVSGRALLHLVLKNMS